MKHALLNDNGLPMAFYDDNIHSDIPAEAIEITDEQWLDCINNHGARKFMDGSVVEHVYQPSESDMLVQKLNDARQYLMSTDHKFYGDYEPKEGEDLEAIKVKRKEARDFIRENAHD